MRIDNAPYYRKGVQLPPLLHDVAAGRITGHSHISQHGHNAVMAAAWELVYPMSQAYTWLNAASTLHISSDAAADTALGTGARTVYIWGLDANWQEISETITMNGVGVVASALQYLRVNGAYVVTAGTGLQNAGNISIMDTTDTWTLQYIEAIQNITHAALYAVPVGYDFYMTCWHAMEVTSSATQFAIYKRGYGELFQFEREIFVRNKGMVFPFEIPLRVPARSDIAILCYHSAGTGSGSAGFEGWIEPA